MKIICVAKNYGERASDEAIFFLKPDTALLRNNDPFYIPDFTRQVDYECELVVRIDRVGRCIDRKFAHRYYSSVTLGIDFTARDLLDGAREGGLPWEAAKAFDRSAAVSPEWVPLVGDVQDLNFEMRLDGEVRQSGWTGDMVFGVDEIVAYVSRFVTLRIGDLIFTGTPAGVGPVSAGQRLTASLEGRELLNFEIR